jgi:hypothetical protein
MAKQFNFKPSKNPVLPANLKVPREETAAFDPSRMANRSSVSFGHLLCLGFAVLVFGFSLVQDRVRVWRGLPVPGEQATLAGEVKEDVKGRIKEAITGKATASRPVFQKPTDWVGKVCVYGGILAVAWAAMQWLGGTNAWFPLASAVCGFGAIAWQIAWAPLLMAMAKSGYQRRTRRRTRRY